ncbi:MAG: hypothetical protein LBS37_07675 [Treponema sp.]|jgi:hypothetical protein|nr:hypothetical protein [Treponema sp.]
MPFFQHLTAKLKTLISAVTGFAGKIREAVQGALQKTLSKIPEKKRRLVVMCAGGGLAVLALAFVLAGLSGRNSSGALPAGERPAADGQIRPPENALPARAVIPPEELFLPDEPDFVPGVLPGRERRTSWTADDAALYWQDPLKNGEERWRERLEAALDEVLERVP